MYASAIVVLFVFVITLLGVDKHETFDEPSRFQRPVAIGLGALMFAQMIVLRGEPLGHGRPLVHGAARRRPHRQRRDARRGLFTDFVWAFEITAVLLVIAVVGGVALARRSSHAPVPNRGEEL